MAAAPPAPSMYHRLVGTHATAMRRLTVAGVIGLIVLVGTAPFFLWPLPALAGWDASGFLLVAFTLHLILTADADATRLHALTDDDTRTTARILVLWIALASLLGVGWALHEAKAHSGGTTASLLIFAALTVLLSWTAVNATFTLHYAHLYFREPGGDIDFGDTAKTDYRDFAYLAFTIGMTYQVSDTALQSKVMRRTVLLHALVAYIFGVVIVATVVNIVASYL